MDTHTDGRAGRAYREHDAATRAAHDDLERAGSLYGYAYVWNARRGAFDIAREIRGDIVTRYLVMENPDGARERERPKWTDNVAQPDRETHTSRGIARTRDGLIIMSTRDHARASDAMRASFTRRDASGTVRAHVARLARARMRARHAEHGLGAPSCDDASFHTQTDAPPRSGTTRTRREDIREGMPTVHAECARMHATRAAQDACTATHTRKRDRRAEYDACVWRAVWRAYDHAGR